MLQGLFAAVLKKQKNKLFAAYVSAPYGTKICDQQGFMASNGGPLLGQLRHQESLVGLVTKGAFEIYLTVPKHVAATRPSSRAGLPEKMLSRRKTTFVLETGALFGLFETYAKYKGPWTIVSGVVSFLVCNPCGNRAKWNRIGRNHDIEDLQIDTRSNCEFDSLIPYAARQRWASEYVLFSPQLILDKRLRLEVENHLRQKTIEQLFSVINQNLTSSGVGDVYEPDTLQLFLEYVDSVIENRTPIFQVMDYNDEGYLPAQALLSELNAYGRACSSPECQWQILVPRMLTAGTTGIFPADLVSGLSVAPGIELLKKDPDQLTKLGLKYKRELALVTEDTVPWILYKNQALIRAFQTKKFVSSSTDKSKKSRTAIHPISLLSNGKQCLCDWSPHLSNIAVVRRTSSGA